MKMKLRHKTVPKTSHTKDDTNMKMTILQKTVQKAIFKERYKHEDEENTKDESKDDTKTTVQIM